MTEVEVFADVACPFTHAALRRFIAHRRETGRERPLLHVRAWPLEFVNGEPHQGAALAPKIAALQAGVAPDLFGGFDANHFPSSSVDAIASEIAAHEVGAEIGEEFSLSVRTALFEHGRNIADPDVLRELRQRLGVPDPTAEHTRQIRADYDEGQQRGVKGSPHFFTESGSFFCPSMEISHEDGGIQVAFDADGFAAFAASVFDAA